jgi:hypothetical protein
MAESKLSLKYEDLKAAAGLFLGYGRGVSKGDATWTTRQSSVLDELVKSGLRQFYFPAPSDKSGVSYEWSFLRPSTTLPLLDGEQTVTLPDDFGGFDGRIQVTTGQTETGLALEVAGMGMIRQMRAEFPTTTGRPLWAAVDPIKGTSVDEGQRFVLEVYPIADRDYTLSCAYSIHPDALSGDRPYAYGGLQHAETIQAAIIAAAELYLDDTQTVRKAYFQERMAVSVSQDRKIKAQMLGYNGDRSNQKFGRSWGTRDNQYRGSVTVNGSTV